MTGLLFLWLLLLIALIVLVVGQARNYGVLTLAYFLGLSLIHVPGALMFISPDLDLFDREVTQLGFQITLIGLAAFVVGALFSRMTGKWRAIPRAQMSPSALSQSLYRFGRYMLAIGSFSYFVLIPISSRFPSSSALIGPLSTTLVLGMWLWLYSANITGNHRRKLVTLAILPLLPAATLAAGGFIGYGVNWALTVIAFLFILSRRRIWFYLAAPPVVMLGLSIFVAYMAERNAIREVVWQQGSGYSERLDRMEGIITNFELFDLGNSMHRQAVLDRLNQNSLVGAGVMRYERGSVDLAYGSTVGLWALIPRAIWPDKPTVGGGGSVVTDFTGISFAEGVSVGAGQVLEFYYNFGLPGVIVGFFALGMLFIRLDRRILEALAVNDARGLLLSGIPGLTLLQPNGNLIEIFVASVGALISARLILRFDPFGAIPASSVRTVGSEDRRQGLPQASARL